MGRVPFDLIFIAFLPQNPTQLKYETILKSSEKTLKPKLQREILECIVLCVARAIFLSNAKWFNYQDVCHIVNINRINVADTLWGLNRFIYSWFNRHQIVSFEFRQYSFISTRTTHCDCELDVYVCMFATKTHSVVSHLAFHSVSSFLFKFRRCVCIYIFFYQSTWNLNFLRCRCRCRFCLLIQLLVFLTCSTTESYF